jgi:hypothetical protein
MAWCLVKHWDNFTFTLLIYTLKAILWLFQVLIRTDSVAQKIFPVILTLWDVVLNSVESFLLLNLQFA